MKDFNGKSLLGQIAYRLQRKKSEAKVVIATSALAQDDAIEEFCESQGLACFRGSEGNVLERYYACAKEHGFDNVVRMTADNPFPDIEELDNLIAFHMGNVNGGKRIPMKNWGSPV